MKQTKIIPCKCSSNVWVQAQFERAIVSIQCTQRFRIPLRMGVWGQHMEQNVCLCTLSEVNCKLKTRKKMRERDIMYYPLCVPHIQRISFGAANEIWRKHTYKHINVYNPIEPINIINTISICTYVAYTHRNRGSSIIKAFDSSCAVHTIYFRKFHPAHVCMISLSSSTIRSIRNWFKRTTKMIHRMKSVCGFVEQAVWGKIAQRKKRKRNFLLKHCGKRELNVQCAAATISEQRKKNNTEWYMCSGCIVPYG